MRVLRRRGPAVVAAILAAAPLAGCGGSSGGASGTRTVPVVVSAPVSTSPWIATFERNGAQLAVDDVNAHGGVVIGHEKARLTLDVRDNAGSPQMAAAIARDAVARHAAMLVIDGVGAAAVADVTDPAHLPVFVVFDGGSSVVDPSTRPTLFRLAPADRYMTMRLADYLAGRHPKVAILSDDTGYGSDGMASLVAAFRRDSIPVVARATVPATTSDVSAQVLAARRAGATAVAVWASAPVVAAAIASARSAAWQVPIWSGPTGEDPLVRQRLAGHPVWLTGVGFVSFRITAEVGSGPFAAYRKAYTARFGVDRVGVQQEGKDVVQPPDWSMFPYDAVHLVAAAIGKVHALGAPLLGTLAGNIVVQGANGDERGYSESSREGVSPDDMYFAVFHGFVFAPVTDDLLSQNLPAVPQTAA